MAHTDNKFHPGQAQKDLYAGGVMQRQIFNSDRTRQGSLVSRVGALLTVAGMLLFSACGGSNSVTENDLPEPPQRDGVPPTLTTVTVQPDGLVEMGDPVRIDFVSSEAIMTPVVTINGMPAEVSGDVTNWRAIRNINAADPTGEVTFSIVFQDISGELGQAVTTTTNDSAACFGPECPRGDDLGPLEGKWQLDFAGVGPAEGDTSWFSIADTGPDGLRACWFDDLYEFGRDGSFRNSQGDQTWVEPWQGAAAEGCDTPVAPHDGSNNAIFQYDDVAETLKLTGTGAFLGLAKVVNGSELTDPALAPGSVTYQVVELIGDSLTVRINFGPGWWEFRLTRVSNLPIVGKWKLNFAGVGPAEGDTSWFSIADTGSTGPRACWFDDVYHFGGDGSFRNYQDGETWVESWQGATAESCGSPVAPHNGGSAGSWYYDDAGTVRLDGVGAYLGLAKVVNGAEVTDPALAPTSVTYDVVELIGDSLTVRINFGPGWWEFSFDRVVDTADLRGMWRLDFAGVGPNAGDTSWFSIADTGPDGPRACWFDDIYQFGRDGSFRNSQGDQTWVEPWQGAIQEACDVPVAPHDGSNSAIFEYDEGAGTLQLEGLGAYLGLAKVVNGSELTDLALAPGSVTYEVVELIGDSLTVRINFGPGWWEFRLTRVSNLALSGNWRLNFAGVGPNEGDTSWFSIADTGATGPRACWFDDIYHFGGNGTFQNFQDGDTWVEPWQGAAAEACGVPVAPHNGSSAGAWYYNEPGSEVRLDGIGSFLSLAKVVNGAELTDPALAPDFVNYNLVELIGDSLTVRINFGVGWWEFVFERD